MVGLNGHVVDTYIHICYLSAHAIVVRGEEVHMLPG